MTGSTEGRPQQWISRLFLAGPPTRLAGGVILAAATAAMFGIGLIDYLSGQRVSLAIFYLLPVMVVATLVGSTPAYLLALESAVVWVAAEALLQHHADVVASAANGAVRVLTLSVVVVLLTALRRAVEDAEAATKAAKAFLSTAAHQLRTPVTGLVVTAEAVAAEVDPTHRARLADTLADSTARVSRLLELLLEVARLDQGVGLQLRPARLDGIVTREIDLVRLRHPGVTFILDGEAPPVLPLDCHVLSEVVANLLDNAGRHAQRSVHVLLHHDGAGVGLRVVDDGQGVPPGAEEAIFERFVTLDGRGGSGLGLAIARAAAESHGGSLVYREGGFELRLPVSQGSAMPVRRMAARVL